MFRLSKWLRRSYRCAIEANIRRTRRSDLSAAGGIKGEPRAVPEWFEWSSRAGDFDIRRDDPFARLPGRVSRRPLILGPGVARRQAACGWNADHARDVAL